MPQPATMGRYRLEATLAQTSDVTVYRGRRRGPEGFEKPVVVWTIAKQRESPQAVVAWASTCASLTHSNIAQVLDAGVVEGGSFVVTEYVSGTSLARAVARAPLAWPVLLDIGAHVANALDHAHTRRDPEGGLLRIAHGSVSAHRILLGTSGDVKLTGFGTPGARRRSAGTSGEGRGEGRDDVFDLARTLAQSMPPDAPQEVHATLAAAKKPLREHRPAPAAFRHALRRVLHDSRCRVTPSMIARVASEAERNGALERPIASTTRDPSWDLARELAAYEAEGRRLVEERAGARGFSLLIGALDLAEALGRDADVTNLALLLSQLAAQEGRLDESLEWRRRAGHTTAAEARGGRSYGVDSVSPASFAGVGSPDSVGVTT